MAPLEAGRDQKQLIRKLQIDSPETNTRIVLQVGQRIGPKYSNNGSDKQSVIHMIQREIVGPNISYHVWIDYQDEVIPWKTFDNPSRSTVEYDTARV